MIGLCYSQSDIHYTLVCGFEIDLKFIEGFRRFSSFILLNLEFDIIMTVVG